MAHVQLARASMHNNRTRSQLYHSCPHAHQCHQAGSLSFHNDQNISALNDIELSGRCQVSRLKNSRPNAFDCVECSHNSRGVCNSTMPMAALRYQNVPSLTFLFASCEWPVGCTPKRGRGEKGRQTNNIESTLYLPRPWCSQCTHHRFNSPLRG
mmetsp:Transcript_28287/g.73148  ORF Transcript_28287/g.73148 Transcript_28287/m.73148 type:complete len:154 (-) Transcript_28287:1406-1867(-)